DEVDREVAVLARGVRERLAALPRLPLAVGLANLERLVRLVERQDRGVAQLERLSGGAVARAQDLLDLARRVLGGQERADRRRGDRVDLGRVRVGGRLAAVAGLVVDPAAQPVQALAADRLDAAARRALQLDGAGAVVE